MGGKGETSNATGEGNIIATQNSNYYVHRNQQTILTRQGRSEAKILFDRSLDHTRENVRGIPESTKGCQCRGGWRHLRGVRKGRCEKHPRAAPKAQGWQVSGPTAAPSLYPQRKRETETDLDSRP